MREVLIQAIGFLGVLFFIISYQIKSNKALYVFQCLGSLMFCLQFFMMDQFSGSFSLIVIIIRNLMLTGYAKQKWIRWKGWLWIFSAICLLILIMTWKGPISLLPFAALTVSTILYWTNNAQKIRLANLACASPAWLIYDFMIGSWGGMLNECITLCSIIVSIYRYGWKAMGKEDSDF